MRFGTTPLTFESVFDFINKEISFDELNSFHLSKVFENTARAGYEHIEIPCDMFQVFPLSMDKNEITQLKRIKQEYNITFSAHLPYLSIDLAGPNKFVREGSVNAIVDAYNRLRDLKDEIDVYVVHPSGETVTDIMSFIKFYPNLAPSVTKIFTEYAKESISNFIQRTGINKNKLAIENVNFPFKETIEIINELGVKLCLDTAHVLAGFSGDIDLLEISKQHLNITKEIHLQDYKSGYVREHCPLGMGNNFPPKFLKLLNQEEFEGPVVFELLHDEVIISCKYIRKFIPELQIPNIH